MKISNEQIANLNNLWGQSTHERNLFKGAILNSGADWFSCEDGYFFEFDNVTIWADSLDPMQSEFAPSVILNDGTGSYEFGIW